MRAPTLVLILALAMLAACAPFGEMSQPAPLSSADRATVTAAANATFAATAQSSAATPLPALQTDPGWSSVAQGASGPTFVQIVIGGSPGTGTATTTAPLGSFVISRSAMIVLLFQCVAPNGVTASMTVTVSDIGSSTITCRSAPQLERDQMQTLSSFAGHRVDASVTLSTDGVLPVWNALVEQPK